MYLFLFGTKTNLKLVALCFVLNHANAMFSKWYFLKKACLYLNHCSVSKPVKDEANLFMNELRFLKRIKISKNNLAFSGHSGKEPFSLQLPSDLPFGVQIGSL